MTRRMIPCPFCGLSPSLEQSVGRTAVACGQCGACGPAFAGHDDAAANDAVADWNTRPFEGALLSRAEAAEAALAAARAEVARLRAVIGDAAVELPVWPEGAYQTPTERDVSAVRAGLYAALGVTR